MNFLRNMLHPASAESAGTAVSMPESAAAQRRERAAIDASTRIPVLVFYASAVFWLLFGSLMGLLSSLKMHHPTTGLLADFAMLTFGRVRPAHLNAVAYGWAATAGLGTAIWLMARLCGTRLVNPILPLIAGVFWNAGVALGIYGVLAGDSRSVEWLEFPNYASPCLFISYALLGIWGVMMILQRKPGHIYVSQWYIFAALFWFPWLYGTAQIMINFVPAQGTIQAAVNWWYGHNALGLFFTPIGLATAYYFIPKIIGRPVHSYYLSVIGFWSLAFFYSWNGMHHLIGGPVPLWMQTASVVASCMMLIPVGVTAINHHTTMRGHFHLLKSSPSLRFVVFGAIMYTATSLQGILEAVPWFNKLVHFTHYTVGHAHLGLYSFFTMMMFGAMYYIIPRLVEWEWPSARMISAHFWLTAVGSLLMFLTLTVGGFLQALALNDDKVTFMAIVDMVNPFLQFRSLAGLMMFAGHIIFGTLFVMMLLKFGEKQSGPTTLGNHEDSSL
ncbi:MAG: cbb3-type cytochrome c oxidase subunit I [Verrucomicrobiae bacterium]|nr:cbb3-type cytochrome c oxidase subunit I [Verrucomicrobiae bacterium]